MKPIAAASWIHKWLALIVGVQVLFWFASGAFFAAYPIERVRSEHRIARAEPAALSLPQMRSGVDLAALLPEAPTRLTYERSASGREVAVAEFPERRPITIDLNDWKVTSPLTADAAAIIAQTYVAGSPRVREARLVTEESPEYRGVLPAWRIAFDDAEGLAVYVAADTGRVTARRSDLWRLYDALWALHIMDWRDHENFNSGLLLLTALTSLIVALSGFVLMPYRLRLPAFTRSSANR
ncbi:PepSY domain-containing protein [Terricaulis sp.]|uniref:PepSY domain-containing protein n=1 Tax=Terricaulis sp. TaxID=2768686 RepID=UPI00378355F8